MRDALKNIQNKTEMKGLGVWMCLLTVLVKFGHRKLAKSAKIAGKSGFSRLELVRARTFEKKVIETWLLTQMKGLDV